MTAKRKTSATKDSSANLGFEAKLWLADDRLRNSMDAAEYKHFVLDLSRAGSHLPQHWRRLIF